MKLTFGGMPVDDFINNKSITIGIEEDLILLEKQVNTLQVLCEVDNGYTVGMEGLVKDIAKTTLYTVPKTVSKAGGKIYKEANNQYKDLKVKWNKSIKPLIIKTIKELGNTLQNIYFKFSKFEEKYKSLGKRIDYVLQHQIKQVGTIPSSGITLHEFEPYVLKGYTVIMNDYKDFYEATIKSIAKNMMTPTEVSSAIKSRKINNLKDSNRKLTNVIAASNEFGDITIPWSVYRDQRYSTFFRTIASSAPTKEDMKSSLSDYVKRTVLVKEVSYKFNINDKTKFVQKVGKFLNIMATVLNNNVINKALEGGGESLKKQTKEFFKEVEGLSKLAITKKPTSSSDKDSDEPVMTEEDEINGELEAYIRGSITLLTKTSTAYTGIVRGSLSALFVLVNEATTACDMIENSVGVRTENKHGVDK